MRRGARQRRRIGASTMTTRNGNGTAAMPAALVIRSRRRITRDNVEQLEIAWTYRTGELGEGFVRADKMSFEATPILIDDTLYLSTPTNIVIALDAGDRQAALALRSEDSSQRALRGSHVARRVVVDRRGRRTDCGLLAANILRHARRAPDRARCAHGPAVRGLRRQRQHRSRQRREADQARRISGHIAARDLSRFGHRRLGDRRQPRASNWNAASCAPSTPAPACNAGRGIRFHVGRSSKRTRLDGRSRRDAPAVRMHGR